MTKKPLKRDNAYYLERLRNEHPGVFSDYQAGRYRNLSAALYAAGLRKGRGGLDGLKSIWQRASQADRDAFKAFIGCVSQKAGVSAPVVSRPASKPVVTAIPSASPPSPSPSARTLPPALADDIRSIMDRRKLKIGAVMKELNMSPLNASLGTALHRGTSVQESLVKALEIWVKANRSV